MDVGFGETHPLDTLMIKIYKMENLDEGPNIESLGDTTVDDFVNDIVVYIASPYTNGDVAVNVRAQIDMVDELMNIQGILPFAPLYSHFQHMIHPRPYKDWIDLDLKWLHKCDCVLRLPSEYESSGADGEVEYAKKLGLPVFYSIEELKKHYFEIPFKKEYYV